MMLNQLQEWAMKTFGLKKDAFEPVIKEDLMIMKDKATGRYTKWIAVYSNSFRDDDLVPEILRSEGHKAYVEKVDAGIYPPPELWIWHTPEWKLGTASVVAVDEVEPGVVFSIASGEIDEGKEAYAKALAESDVTWRMSHTFYSMDRNDEDDSFSEWFTSEVSALPAGKEANPLTGFGFVEGEKMIDPKKRMELISLLGVSDDFLDGLEAQNIGARNMAQQEEREFKSKSGAGETEAVAAEVPEVPAETEEVEDVVAEAEVEPEPADVADVEAADIVAEDTPVAAEAVEQPAVGSAGEALASSVSGVLSTLGILDKSVGVLATGMNATNQRLDRLEEGMAAIVQLANDVREIKEKMAEEQKKEAATPLSSMLSYNSIIGKARAQATAEDELKGPEEAEQVSKEVQQYGSFLGNLIAGAKPHAQ